MGSVKALSPARQYDQLPFSFKPRGVETGISSLTGFNTEEDPAGDQNICLNLLRIKLIWRA